MQKIIASFLVQKRECSLPGLGSFKLNTLPASLDVASKKMFPPATEFIFYEGEALLQTDLINYVSLQQNVSEEQAAENVTRWCHTVIANLDAGEKIVFESIGNLQKNAAGNIFLHTEEEVRLYDAVIAERVIHKNEEHAVLVGDTQTTSAAMSEYYKTETVFERKISWKTWALVLVSLSLVALVIHFSYHSFTTASMGNQISVSPLPPPVSYTSIK